MFKILPFLLLFVAVQAAPVPNNAMARQLDLFTGDPQLELLNLPEEQLQYSHDKTVVARQFDDDLFGGDFELTQTPNRDRQSDRLDAPPRPPLRQSPDAPTPLQKGRDKNVVTPPSGDEGFEIDEDTFNGQLADPRFEQGS